MENIKSSKIYALVDSGLKFTHYSYECKKHREREKVSGVHGGHSFPICSFFLGQHLIASVLHTVGPGILFQIFFTLKKKKKFPGVCSVFRLLSFKLLADEVPGRGGQRSLMLLPRRFHPSWKEKELL